MDIEYQTENMENHGKQHFCDPKIKKFKKIIVFRIFKKKKSSKISALLNCS